MLYLTSFFEIVFPDCSML